MLPVNTLKDMRLFTWDPWGFYEEGLDGRDSPLELSEDKGRYIVKARVPGLKPRNLRVVLEGTTLCIQGERRDRRGEMRITYTRSIELPHHVRTDEITASVKNEVLEVRLPLLRRQKPRVIAVQEG